MSLLKICWPNFQIVETENLGGGVSLPGTVDVWSELLKDHGVEDAIQVIRDMTATRSGESAPAISDVRSEIIKLEQQRVMEANRKRCREMDEESRKPFVQASPEALREFFIDMDEAVNKALERKAAQSKRLRLSKANDGMSVGNFIKETIR